MAVLLEPLSTTARSAVPSPLQSAMATDFGDRPCKKLSGNGRRPGAGHPAGPSSRRLPKLSAVWREIGAFAQMTSARGPKECQ